MTIARITELDRRTTQSGKANNGLWLLEFERQQALRPDPLTGWNGSGDTSTQVRMTFKSKEDAIAFCEKQGLQYHLVPAAPVRTQDPGLRRQFPLDACQPPPPARNEAPSQGEACTITVLRSLSVPALRPSNLHL